MKQAKSRFGAVFICFIGIFTALLAIFLPSALSNLGDGAIVGASHLQDAPDSFTGYHHLLSLPEKLNLLSQERYGTGSVMESGFAPQELLAENELDDVCQAELGKLIALGVLPPLDSFASSTKTKNLATYVDSLSPQKSVSVWQVACSTSFYDLYLDVDAGTGTVLSLALYSSELVPKLSLYDAAMGWGEYLGLGPVDELLKKELLQEEPNPRKGPYYYIPYQKDGSYVVYQCVYIPADGVFSLQVNYVTVNGIPADGSSAISGN